MKANEYQDSRNFRSFLFTIRISWFKFKEKLFSARIEDELIKLMINTNGLSENESRNAVNKYQLLITLFIILMKGKKKKTNNTVPYMKILYFQRTCILYFPSKRSVKYNVWNNTTVYLYHYIHVTSN